MRTAVIYAKNREHANKLARMKHGDKYYVISVRPSTRKNLFGATKKEYEVVIGILEQISK